MTDRKKPSAGFWITVALVAVLVGYPLSFGPACWLVRREKLSRQATARIYNPLLWVIFNRHNPIKPTKTTLRTYCEYFAPRRMRLVGFGSGGLFEDGVLEDLRAESKFRNLVRQAK